MEKGLKDKEENDIVCKDIDRIKTTVCVCIYMGSENLKKWIFIINYKISFC